MKNTSVRKTAVILGICVICLSLIMFLVSEIAYTFSIIEYLKNSAGLSFSFTYIGGFISPFSYLISGFGFGLVIILLAQMIDSAKTILVSQESGKVDSEDQAE